MILWKEKMLFLCKRVGAEFACIKCFLKERNRGDLMVSVGFAVVDRPFGVATGGVLCALVRILDPQTPFHLLNCSEDVKKLIDRICLGAFGKCIHFDKCGADESGGGGPVSGEPHGTRSARVCGQWEIA